mgnify:CR=1 FL=1
MLENLKAVIKNVLIEIYHPFGFALILSALFMYVYKQCDSWKTAIKRWINWFRTDASFRKMFIFIAYLVIILYRTLTNRGMAINTVDNVIGIWKINNFDENYKQIVLVNLVLFIPFTILLFWNFASKLLKNLKFTTIILQSLKITFLFSLAIEFLQLFLRTGVWQISDLFFNTLGGIIGGILYWIVLNIKNKKE